MRNIITVFYLLLTLLVYQSCKSDPENENVSREEWEPLFNGKDLSGWDIKIKGYSLNENYKNTFRVEDSMI
ncbi:MAG TPA: DUF1080 domain-containing protein, partial [Chitinophagaceae bacterium]|nr:DUF1080 domain-containing protein [Chitinophagaceae bacterium]